MEALAALGLAATIFQVIDFSTGFLLLLRQTLQDGSGSHVPQLEVIARSLKSSSAAAKEWARPPDEAQQQTSATLEKLADEVDKIADELLGILSGLSVQPGSPLLRRALTAVKAVWSKGKIDGTRERLTALRDELQFEVIVALAAKVDRVQLCNNARFQTADDQTQRIIEAIVDGRNDLRALIAGEIGEACRENAVDQAASAEQRHEETLSAIETVASRLEQHLQFSQQQQPPGDDPPSAPATPNAHQVLESIQTCLSFEREFDRYEDIDSACLKTFEWIYRPPEPPDGSTTPVAPWADFSEWLKTGRGVYWISGRAGSGKSTLMKFLSDDLRTTEALRQWAGDMPLLVASFYFWNAGTELQKSQEGLLRSLLLQALQAMPSLGPILFPEPYRRPVRWEEFPTFHQLKRAFRRLMAQDIVPLKVALLIDGLDEFETPKLTLADLADLFTAATASPNVKAVLSSRPLVVFEDAFRSCAKLRLHDLTRQDITIYVGKNLEQNENMARLARERPTEATELVDEIVSSAHGVFLWVKMAVRSLLEGLRNFDTIAVLKERLRELPADLEDLFRHMMRRIPPRYRATLPKISKLLDAVVDMRGKYDMLRGGFYLSALKLSFMNLDLQAVIAADIRSFRDEEVYRRWEEVEAHLKSHCAGLFELNDWRGVVAEEKAEQLVIYDPGVHYLHRTVADFLRRDEVRREMVEGAMEAEATFNVHEFFLRTALMAAKRHSLLSTPRLNAHHLLGQACIAMASARELELSAGTPQDLALDELDRVLTSHFRSGAISSLVQPSLLSRVSREDACTSWYDVFIKMWNLGRGRGENFLSLAVQFRLKQYLAAKLKKDGGEIIPKEGRPLLDLACHPPHLLLRRIPKAPGIDPVDPTLVSLLLQYGADPNERSEPESPWQRLLSRKIWEMHETEYRPWLAVAELFLEHGADPHATIDDRTNDVRYSALYAVQRAFFYNTKSNILDSQPFKADEAEIVDMLKARGARAKLWQAIIEKDEEGTVVSTKYERVYPESWGAVFLDTRDRKPSLKKTALAFLRLSPVRTVQY